VRTLDQLPVGSSARVVRLRAAGAIGQRLCEMGLVEGTGVRLVRFAPLGDPLEIEVQDYLLSLRKSEARLVEISDPTAP
jgi:ferrous iron transport protein A